MAGDWIKMRCDLYEDPAVIRMAELLDTREEHVVGYCHKLWCWVSRQCNGPSVTGVTLSALGRILSLPGFPEMMVKVGWLEFKEVEQIPTITIPNFDRHLSQTAKVRALTNRRVSNSRCNAPSVTKALPEKRREEKSIKKENSKRKKFEPPTPEDVAAYCRERKNRVDAEQFVDYYQARGWQLSNGRSMKDWQAAVRTWERNDKGGSAAAAPARGDAESKEFVQREALRVRFWKAGERDESRIQAMVDEAMRASQ